jgi:hypothetical protein
MIAATNIPPAAAQQFPTNALHDIKPPLVIPNAWLWVIWGLVAAAVLAAAFVLWRAWQRRRAQPIVIPVVPPHVRARQKLEQALALLGQPREFCILVSDTIRLYLEERFDFRAPERTTEEFLYELRRTDLLMAQQKESLGDFLQRCDLVKFARYEPAEPELRDLHASALRLIDETEPGAAITGIPAHPAANPSAPITTPHSASP